MDCRAEITVEPFVEATPGPAVEAVVHSAQAVGLDVELGPFSTVLEGDSSTVLGALEDVAAAAIAAGADGISVRVEVGTSIRIAERRLFQALEPIADLVGGEIVGPDDRDDGTVPLEWAGEVVGGFRLMPMQSAIDRMVAVVERELGTSLDRLSRTQKQVAVRVLDERGAFQLRRSIEDVADRMGVSRITIYNYLNSTRSKTAIED